MKILPISELKNTADISEICETENEPVYITKNGYGHLVIMSLNTYERKIAKLELYEKITEAENDITEGKISPAEEVFARLEKKYGK
jgi:PHD/YefM family antitoxin component YafN of YafNO toxin-antitoxin module